MAKKPRLTASRSPFGSLRQSVILLGAQIRRALQGLGAAGNQKLELTNHAVVIGDPALDRLEDGFVATADDSARNRPNQGVLERLARHHPADQEIGVLEADPGDPTSELSARFLRSLRESSRSTSCSRM